MGSRRIWAALLLFCGLAVPGNGWAHDVPQSAMFLDIGAHAIDVELHLPLSELGAALQLPLAAAPAAVIPQYGVRIRQYVGDGLQLQAHDGRTFVPTVGSLVLQHTNNLNWTSNDWLVVRARLVAPDGDTTEMFGIDDRLIVTRVLSHQTLVYVRRDIRNGLIGDKPIPIGLLGFGRTHLDVDGSGGSWWQGFRHLFGLGLQHIAEGTDHQLFLLALLLPAPLIAGAVRWQTPASLGRSLRNLAGIVTGFTLGHSITLALSATGLVAAPVRVVEILIAVSILFSSLHAWRPLFAGREIWIASGFGLVHGLAFAEMLAGLNFDGWSLLLSLLGFNLGIETMQLAMVALVFPWLFLLSRTRCYHIVRGGGALFAAASAAGWVAQRISDHSNYIASFADDVLSHRTFLIAVLAFIALGAQARFRHDHAGAGLARS